MRLKDLFTVPSGQKITEKHLRRVLISSICSMLLCMGCLVGTTWAWFSVSIVNTDNVIQIGNFQPPASTDPTTVEVETTAPTTETTVPTTEATVPETTEATVPETTEATVPATEATVPETTEATEAATEATQPDNT